MWLDAGIVPFDARLGEPIVPEGYATGAARGLTRADLPDHATWEEWFPADWVCEMREQIRLWFSSQLFMSVALTGKAPFHRVFGYEKMLDETGREMHSSWGNTIDAPDAFARMGTNVMRWQFCAQPPDRNLLFGFGPAREIQRKLLPLALGHVPDAVRQRRVVHAALRGPRRGQRGRTPRSTAGSSSARACSWRRRPRPRAVADEGRVIRVRVVSRRPSRTGTSAARGGASGDETALRVLWHALAQSLRVIAPIYSSRSTSGRCSSASRAPDAPDSVHLAGWPAAPEADAVGLGATASARRIVDLGRVARSSSGVKLRQPLAGSSSTSPTTSSRSCATSFVKDVTLGHVEAELVVKPNLRFLGPKLGASLGPVRAALATGEFEDLGDGRFRVAGHELSPEEVLVERSARDGWAIASSDGVTVALDTGVNEGLEREARVYELIHQVNTMRKEGLALTDRIALQISSRDADLLDTELMKSATLATSLEAGGEDVVLAKA